MIEKGISVFRGERVLLLQGPVGPFFRRLADDLTFAGAQVFKVNFNGGDWLFYSGDAFNYCGRTEDWPAYFEALLDQLNVDIVMLFGDCRPIHKSAHKIAHRRGLQIGVFEEGYIRPDYVTLEQFGVNYHSLTPRDPGFYTKLQAPAIDRPIPLGNTYWHAVLWAVLYYFAAGLLKPFFRHYRHHRPLTWMEIVPWARSVWRKAYYALKERRTFARLTGELEGRYFLVPLQVYNDAQIHTHSGFKSISHFINKVMASFARNAPRDTALVIKHHPMDRGYHDYTRLIREQAREFGLEGRCFYVHDQHLPTLTANSRGVVVINSTVGLSALHHDTPVKVCGNAIYDMPGLTFSGSLDEFWQASALAKPDAALLQRFNGYLVRHTQLNGSFYKRLPIIASVAGLRWTLKIDNVVTLKPTEKMDKAA